MREGGNMELRHVRYFVAIAEARSFAAASRQLSISQPALSTRIKELELELGTKLFKRHSRGVVPTETGERLLSHARSVLVAAERMVSTARATVKEISIGTSPTPSLTVLPELLEQCHARYPDLRILVRHGSGADLHALLANGEIDAVLCYGRSPAGRALPLFSEDLVLVGAPGSADAGTGGIDFRELRRLPLVLDHRNHFSRRLIREIARDEKIELDIRDEVDPVVLKRDIILRHQRFSIVPYGLFIDDIAAGTMVAQPIHSPAISLTLYLSLGRTMHRQVVKSLIPLVEAIALRGIESQHYRWRAVGR
jgi:LysR family transcriptional regulator, nitrogen assimilation regulatory protein